MGGSVLREAVQFRERLAESWGNDRSSPNKPAVEGGKLFSPPPIILEFRVLPFNGVRSPELRRLFNPKRSCRPLWEPNRSSEGWPQLERGCWPRGLIRQGSAADALSLLHCLQERHPELLRCCPCAQ